MARKITLFVCLLASMNVLVSCVAFPQFIGNRHHHHGYQGVAPIVRAVPVSQQGFFDGPVPVQVVPRGYSSAFGPMHPFQQGYNPGYQGHGYVPGGYYPGEPSLLDRANHFVKRNWPLLLAGGAAIALARG